MPTADDGSTDRVCEELPESALRDLVGDFQALAAELYLKETGDVAPKNAFQRLRHGSDLWKKATGSAYEDLIPAAELARLNVFFGRRHLLEHTGGKVDHPYIDSTGDRSYAVGQRIVVTVGDAQEMLGLVRKLASGMRSSL